MTFCRRRLHHGRAGGHLNGSWAFSAARSTPSPWPTQETSLQFALMVHGVAWRPSCRLHLYATAEVISACWPLSGVRDSRERSSFNIRSRRIEAERSMRLRKGEKYRCAGIMASPVRRPQTADLEHDRTRQNRLVLIADAAKPLAANRRQEDRHAAPITTPSFFSGQATWVLRGDCCAIFTDDEQLAAALRSLRVTSQGQGKYETRCAIASTAARYAAQAAILLRNCGSTRRKCSVATKSARAKQFTAAGNGHQHPQQADYRL